jgi:branched-chain amino acid transport system permease protein
MIKESGAILKILGWSGLILLAYLLPLIIGPYYVALLVLVFYYAYINATFNLVAGYTGLFNFGMTAYIGLGCYCSALLYLKFGISPWLGMLCGAALSALFGIATVYLLIRAGLKGPYFAVCLLAFALLLFFLFTNIEALGGARGVQLPVFEKGALLFQFKSSVDYYYLILTMLIILLLLTFLILKSKVGYYFIAIRENERAAWSLGINVLRYQLVSTGLSAALCSFAGTFYIQYYLNADPHTLFGLPQALQTVIYVFVGGMGTLLGPVVGSGILVFASEIARKLSAQSAEFAAMRMAMYGIVIIVVMLFMPYGIMGWVNGIIHRRIEGEAL